LKIDFVLLKFWDYDPF